MKDIKNFVCTFEQSKKLKELGVAQECLFFWISPTEVVYALSVEKPVVSGPTNYAAFTVQELLELLAPLANFNDNMQAQHSHHVAVDPTGVLSATRHVYPNNSANAYPNTNAPVVPNQLNQGNYESREYQGMGFGVDTKTAQKSADLLIRLLGEKKAGNPVVAV